jgi:hypothetical protein
MIYKYCHSYLFYDVSVGIDAICGHVSKCVTANIINGALCMTSDSINSLNPHYYVYNKHTLFISMLHVSAKLDYLYA